MCEFDLSTRVLGGLRSCAGGVSAPPVLFHVRTTLQFVVHRVPPLFPRSPTPRTGTGTGSRIYYPSVGRPSCFVFPVKIHLLFDSTVSILTPRVVRPYFDI